MPKACGTVQRRQWDVGRRHRGQDAGQSLGPRGVDAGDASVSVGAAQDVGVQHARNADVYAEDRVPGDLVDAVVADGAGSNDV